MKVGDKVRLKSGTEWGEAVAVYPDTYNRKLRIWCKVRWANGWEGKHLTCELTKEPVCTPGALGAMNAALDAKPARHMERWTIEEDDKLVRRVRRHESPRGIRVEHQRTEEAIRSRLLKLYQNEWMQNPTGLMLGDLAAVDTLMRRMQQQKSGYTNRAVRATWGTTLAQHRAELERGKGLESWFKPTSYQRAAVDAMLYGTGFFTSPRAMGTAETVRQLQEECNATRARMADVVQRSMPRVLSDHGADAMRFAFDPIKPQEEKPIMEKFYIVVHVEAGVKPATREQAIEIANTKARQNPESTFYIMEAIEAVSLVQPKVAVTTLKAAPQARAKRKAATKRKAKR